MSKYLIRLTGSLLCTTLVFGTAVVVAAEMPVKTGDFENQWYLGAGLGQSRLKPDTDNTDYRVDDKSDTGYKFFVGYDLSERLSLEGYFSWLGESRLQSTLQPDGKLEYKDFGINVVYYLYKSRQPHTGWGIFGRGGIGRMQNTGNIPYERNNDNHIMLGAGVEYGFNNGLALRVDADFYDADAQLVAISVLKRFGADKKTPAPQPVVVVDSDNDGVIDNEDRCPGSPADVMVDMQGCERDSDNDGIVNSRDKCPDSSPDAKVDLHGCKLDSDKDSDGIIDENDKCPDTPSGTTVDLYGCALDSDKDGIIDENDKCPDSPAGAKVDPRGCELDGDADGVVDSQDHCLETPAETAVDVNGCELQAIIVLKGVTFATASEELIGDSRRVLNEVVNTLRRNPELKLEIAGHTDNRGKRAYNVHLSQQRADSVRNYLTAQGISGTRLEAKGYGPADAIADNDTENGRAINRRVELHIIE